MSDKLMQLVGRADPLASYSGSALTVSPEVVLSALLDRYTFTRRERRRRPVLIAAVAAAVLIIGSGVAIADGLNPFAGIGAANHSPSNEDALDPTSITMIKHVNDTFANLAAHTGVPAVSVLPDTARLITELASGRRVYVLSTTSDDLCVLTTPPPNTANDNMRGISCGNPLSKDQPTTIEEEDQVVNGPNATPPLTYGVARDDVTAVSFMANGTEQTVPVTNNVWAYEGQNSADQSLTIHYANGSAQTIDH